MIKSVRGRAGDGIGRLVSSLAALLVVGCAPARPSAPPVDAAPSGPSWADLRREARRAHAAKDFPLYRARVDQLFERSGSAAVLYELAYADALVGDRARAFADLSDFAATGLTADVDADGDFEPLRSDRRFDDLRQRIARNNAPVGAAEALVALPGEGLLPEDIAYDAISRRFFVSSIRGRKIMTVDRDGTVRDFIASGAGGPGGICGVTVHGDRVWATAAVLPPVPGFVAGGDHPTAVVAFDRRSGGILERIDLAPDGVEHALTDLAVGPAGDVFASDAIGGNLYRVRPGAHRLDAVARSGEFISPQTPAPAADGRTLFVPDYVRGLAAVDLETGRVQWLSHGRDVALNGIDGVYLVPRDGPDRRGDPSSRQQLLAVQNGTAPIRVVRLTLDRARARVVSLEVLLQGAPALGEPTHGVVVDGAFFILANSGWNRFDARGALRTDAPADAPAILRLTFEQTAPRHR